MNRWTRRLVQGLSIAALGLVGCAQERAPINRVQPNALDKSFFVGEKLNDDSDNPVFYSRAFVVDQSVGQNGISVGLYSGTDRIKWEITEDALIGRKAYQIAQGQDDHGVPGKVNGTIVAKYKIESHFDIKRSYNPQTGEELNIVEENSSDRPWQLRQYMRVDWSTNQVMDPMWSEMFFGKVFGDMSVEPLTYTVTDPTAEDAPHFEAKDGYFDVTNKYYVAPEETHMWGMTFPTCALVGLYTSTTTYDCNPQEATVRHSFWKVDPNHDYQPDENTYRKMDVIASFGGAGDSFQPAFAGGTTQCWDPQYAYTDACFHQYLAKLNFWEKSHWEQPCDDNTDEDKDGQADQCAGYSGPNKGSQCDTVVKKCTIPLRDRHIAPQGYWMNKETPAELLDALDANGNPGDANGPIALLDENGAPAAANAAYKVPAKRGAMEDVVKSWNQLLTNALAYGREVECRRTGGDRDSCHWQYFTQDPNDSTKDATQMVAFGGWGVPIAKPQPGDGPAVLVACHAPVRDYDYQPVCGTVNLEKKCDVKSTDARQCGGPGTGCNPAGHCADQLRVGDQRKNVIFYWPWDSDAHYGGVAGLGQDPETGEEHGVSATVMGRSATRAAAVYRDYLQVAMYDFTVDDITTGVPQYVYNKVLQNGYSPLSESARKARGEKITYGAQGGSNAAKGKGNGGGMQGQFKMNFSQNALTQKLVDQNSTAMSPVLQNTTQPLWESYAAKLRGTPWEAQIVDPTWAMQATGADPRQPVSGSTLDAASPFRNLDPGRLAVWRAQIAGTLANKGICFVDDVPRVGSINFQGLARWYMDKFHDMGLDTDVQVDPNTGMWLPGPRDPGLVKQRGELMYRELFHGMATGIAIHEVGHTLGMRHNFASSYDSPNYMPQYWQLRTHEGTAAQECNGPRDPNKPDTCVGPRFDDPMDTDELGFDNRDANGRSQGRPAVGYFGNSTVMEYEQDYMSPGMAPYDFSYVKAVYGGVLETYDIDRVGQGGIDEAKQGDFLPNLALQRSEIWIEGSPDIHYTNLARDLKVFDPSYCRDATPEELEQGQWRVVHGKVCTQSPRDHWAWRDFSDDANDGVTPPTPYVSYFNFTAWHVNPAAPGYDGRDRERWSYRYGETYGSGYLHTNYSDNGADPYEIITNQGQMFEATYPLTYFRHGNKEYSYFNLPSATADRYFERMRSYHWLLADLFSYGDPANTNVYEMSRQETFYNLVRAATSPEPGPMKLFAHYEQAGSDPSTATSRTYYDVDSNNAVTLPADFQTPIMEGRYVADEFSDKKGGQWDYLSWIDHAGFGLERGLALMALLDGRPTLYTISRQTFLDGRDVMRNYRMDDPDGVDRLLGGILSENWSTVAPWVADASSNIPDPNGGLSYRSLQQLNLLDPNPTRPAGSVPVFPNIGYKNQVLSVAVSMLYAAMNSDKTLAKKLRVYYDGIDIVPNSIPASELISFTDPNSGYTYVARKFGDQTVAGVTVDKGIASRMIDHAQVLLAKKGANSQDYQNYVGLIDAVHDIGILFWDASAWQAIEHATN